MEKETIKLSIIIPCYNEAENIPLILKKFQSVIDRKDIEIILVNNGSKDHTEAVLDEQIQNHPFAKRVKVDVNQGYGYGILCGLKEAKGEFIGYTHADMQTDPYDTIKALAILETQTVPQQSYIKGRRKGRSFFDQVFTIGMSFFESIYLGQKLWDINAQPNIFHRSFFDMIQHNCPKDFSLDLYILYMAKIKQLHIIRFDVVFPARIHGTSSWNTGIVSKWKFIKRTIEFSLKLKKIL